MNIVVLRGVVSRQPEVRTLASGADVLSFEVCTPVGGSQATVPVTWISPPVSAAFTVGDEVVVLGSVRRRFFRAGGGTQSRTEVVADRVAKAAGRRTVERLLVEARQGLEAG